MNKIKIGLSIILLIMSINVVNADTQIRYPDNDFIEYCSLWNINPTNPTTCWDKIDDSNNSDYIYTGNLRTDYYTVLSTNNFSVPTNSTINDLTVHTVSKKGSGGGTQTIALKITIFDLASNGSVAYTGSAIQQTTLYSSYSYTWLKNPQTLNNWTVNEINSMGNNHYLKHFGLIDLEGSSTKYISQLYISINYTPPSVISNGYLPPTPTLNSITTGNFWVNTSWTAGAGNITNSYNYSVNGGAWTNGTTNTYHNSTLSAHAWHNITVYAYNNSGDGNLSVSPLIDNTQIPNNVPVQQAIGDQIIGVGKWLNFSIISTDADSDSLTYGTNATLGTLTGNNFSFKPTINDVGIYYWSYNTSDGYGGIATETIKVTVKRNTVTHLALVG